MRSKLVLAALAILSTVPVFSQVAPAARIKGLPLGVGFGVSNYDTDYYGPDLPYWSGRMTGVSAWANYRVYRSFAVEVEGTTLFSGAPQPRSSIKNVKATGDLKQENFQGGLLYKFRPVFKMRPYLKGMGGIGYMDFPSTNPFYKSENAAVYSAAGGIEYRVWKTFNVRAQYEYQWWKGFRSNSSLTPSGLTVGATYYLRGVHRHY